MTVAPSKPKPVAPAKPKPVVPASLPVPAAAAAAAAAAARPAAGSAASADGDDFLSHKATVALIRRVLVHDDGTSPRDGEKNREKPPLPLEAVLPPLTSSNEVDIELYAIIAIVIRDFVKSWYGLITPDHGLVDETIHTIAHCTRALEQRLRQTDIIGVLLDEVPGLVERHIDAYRTATRPQTAVAHGPNARQIYHALNPHPALKADQADQAEQPKQPDHAEQPKQTDRPDQDQTYQYRQLLVQAVLAVLLPTEDLQNAGLRILVTDIFADLILRQAVDDKLSDPAFLYRLLCNGLKCASTVSTASTVSVSTNAQSRLDKFGLLSSAQDEGVSLKTSLQSRLFSRFWTLLYSLYLSLVAVRFIVLGLLQARRSGTTSPAASPNNPKRIHSAPMDQSGNRNGNGHGKGDLYTYAVLDYRIFSTFSTLLKTASRMPWLLAFFAFWHHLVFSVSIPGLNTTRTIAQTTTVTTATATATTATTTTAAAAAAADGGGTVGGTTGGASTRASTVGSLLNRFAYNTLRQYVFVPSRIPPTLRAARAAIFPNNSLQQAGAAATPAPSKSVLELRQQAASELVSLIPPVVKHVYYATSKEEEICQAVEEDILAVFGDAWMNKHLLYAIVELILVRLIPEIAERTPAELLADRGVFV